MNKFEKIIGSGFGTGFLYLSKNKKNSASGTFASLVATIIYFIPNFEKLYIIIPFIILFTIIGILISSKFEKEYGKDPKECTIDEVVGTWISYLFLPKSLIIIAIAFLLWRLLDIIKLPPANYYDKKTGGLSIMLDDIISGVYTAIIVNIIAFFL
ncbi:MAG TPA: phosphatidylglycerophosphatase A [Ignavibacteriales bacterium]|nr:phosphatidylglycerophosphatase A [Bacteroidales bacterium]HOJ37274.1 phosphatidylglycerophosphatase A [Ignavibacteriales bacterium]HOL80388.1 phosphatidylglycerophosphatase A [Ignavibacteriales bacterium]HOM64839.1 phosphatidylglycerophosphatase A [Ignavibacteriales bacterium]HPD67428.1 phosphatidylglycerophosphatase A [Ignavibacteriales bacterium]